MSRFLVKFIVLPVLLAMAVFIWLWMDVQEYLDTPLKLQQDELLLEVKSGDNFTRITGKLTQQGILSNPRYLRLYVRLTQQLNKIHIGEYKLSTGMTPRQLLDMLAQGRIMQYSFTIIEGWTFKQLLMELKKNTHLEHQLTSRDEASVMQALGYDGIKAEGRFMPDTYHFPKGMTDVAFLRRAYQSMQDYLQAVWPKRDVGLPIETPYEALILASIVEKETGRAEERAAIAGVFARRLQKGMRLQSDPTTIYGMGDRYKGNISRKDLLADTPYNTYRIKGLPPTPIAFPGREAIDAVLHPQPGDALYFVSKGNGRHYFSSTLEEHNQAVIKYQLKGRRKNFSSYKIDAEKQDE